MFQHALANRDEPRIDALVQCSGRIGGRPDVATRVLHGAATLGDADAVASDGDTGPSIVFENLGKTVAVKKGTTILDAAIAAGVDLDHYCGGMASCGSCRVQILADSQVSEMDMMEEATLDVVMEHDDDRLGCQTRILGPVKVLVPDQD